MGMEDAATGGIGADGAGFDEVDGAGAALELAAAAASGFGFFFILPSCFLTGGAGVGFVSTCDDG